MNRNIFSKTENIFRKKTICFKTNIQMAESLVWEKSGYSQDCAIGGL